MPNPTESTPLVGEETGDVVSVTAAFHRSLSQVSDVPGMVPDREISRDELLRIGHTREQADQTLVRINAQRVLQEIAGPWVLVWAGLLGVLFLAVFVSVLVLAYQWIRFLLSDQKCDAPLHKWIVIALCMYFLNQGVFNRPGFRRWAFGDPRVNEDAETLAGVVEFSRGQQVFVGLQIVVDVSWKVLGLYWAYTAPTCADTAPGFWYAFVVFLWLALAGSAATWAGLITVLRMLDSMHVLRPPPQLAAPDGTVEKCTKLEFSSRFNGEDLPRTCPICIDAFDADSPIRETGCGHVFHEECLQDWLRRARTCPLCREDLAGASAV